MSSSHSWINTILLVDVFVVDDALGRRRRRRRRQTPHILFSIIGGHLHTRATNENLRLVEKSKFPSLSLSTHTNTHTHANAKSNPPRLREQFFVFRCDESATDRQTQMHRVRHERMYVQQKKCGRVDISKTSHNDSKPTKTLNQLVLDNSISRSSRDDAAHTNTRARDRGKIDRTRRRRRITTYHDDVSRERERERE